MGNGIQYCPYSTSVLGNPQKRHAQDNTSSSNNSNGDWSPLKTALFQTIQKQLLLSNSDDNDILSANQENEERKNYWRQQVQNLDTKICPAKLEVLGDDKNLVLPATALLISDLEAWMQQTITKVDSSSQISVPCMAEFMTEMWDQITKTYQCPRILRKGGVDAESKIRQTGYSLLWPTSTPISNNWITVTEQGIRQSFDVTNVMFSRGNITEKIRFGKTLVQPGDVVLDLYAGIGYYTLPALVHGKAAFVYACEWNDKAIEALRYNLVDNQVAHKSMVIPGDSRQLILPSLEQLSKAATRTTTTTNNSSTIGPINRISLGLLPSSEGCWHVAVQALMGTLRNQAPSTEPAVGGWLHVHGNVPVKERDNWMQWLCQCLHEHVLTEITKPDTHHNHNDKDWVVVCHHVEKVKSFAPTVNHYVADVFIGPRTRARRCFHPQLQQRQQHGDSYLQLNESGTCFYFDNTTEHLLEIPKDSPPPSCELSADGVLYQGWMMPV